MEASGAGAQKVRRQARILEVIAASVVETQEDLAERLNAEGFTVTQATVSRDIHDLRLIKLPTGDGGSRYAQGPADAEAALSARLLGLFGECVTGVDASLNLVVLSTLAGTAAGVAEAVDRLRAPEVIGTLAGERTVFVVIKPPEAVGSFLERVQRLRGLPPAAAAPPGGA